MTEKIGAIKNPLTIIAVFAGIAEVSGTIVLPFVTEENQLLFIYFLVFFPSALVIIFFLTLNFNNKALYAPSDYNDEENYIKIFRYDIARQENVEVQVKPEDLVQMINENISSLEMKIDQRFRLLKAEFNAFASKESASSENKSSNGQIQFDLIDESQESEPEVSISDMPGANSLKRRLDRVGIFSKIYNPPYSERFETKKLSDYKAIWIGSRVPLERAKIIIKTSLEYFPHLQYIDLSDLDKFAPDYVHDQIYIGGATNSAIDRGLKKVSRQNFEKILNSTSLDDFHEAIKDFRP